MTTSQSIREKGFATSKAMFGGYEMTAVDDYLDQLANDFAALQKENDTLKEKMRVLVKKIEEYRGNEDAVNRAILSAQKLSVQIENDARARAAAIVSEAEQKSASVLSSIDQRIALEEKRLQMAKISSAKFVDSARELCKKQLDAIETIAVATALGNEREEARISAERLAAEKEAFDAGNTQIFTLSKDI